MTVEITNSAGEPLVNIEHPAEGVARIVLNRAEKRNAQNFGMLYQLDAAFTTCARDESVAVIILAADGPDFSSGHDLKQRDVQPTDFDVLGNWADFTAPGAEGRYAVEKEVYLDLTERWRNVPKPTIAQVQGRCISGGLMLVMACDLVIAADNAAFCDNTIDLGVCGTEFFNHPYDFGIRKAKELLFTAGWFSAQEAAATGFVNRVVPRAELEASTLNMASVIAAKPRFALKMAKEAINAAHDAMGRPQAMSTIFALHQLCHSHNMQVYGLPVSTLEINKP
jgi:enoyl-CoA hydratase